MWNFSKLNKTVLLNEETCIKWCQSVSLIRNIINCPECGSEMKLYLKEYQFRCCLNNHTIKIPIRSKTWFENSKLSFEKILILTYMFATGNTKYTEMIRETSLDDKTTDMHTIADWQSYCREICMMSLDKYYNLDGKIGGVGHVIQVDETKVGKRKFNRGRCVEGQWILGMLDLGTSSEKKCSLRLEMCPNNKRDSETLLNLIKRHVKIGSIIHSDKWKGYDCLTKNGYIHQLVNHSEYFVDPITKVHTQNIECEWRQLKRKLHSGGYHHEYMADYLCEYLWRKVIKFEKKDPFIEFINSISNVYNDII